MENINDAKRHLKKLDKTEFISGSILKALAIIASCYGMFRTIVGPISFTYFTNQSNLFVDIALLIALIMDVMVYKGKKEERNDWVYFLKFLATISITLTFLVYMLILAPTSQGGFFNAYFRNYAGSFFVHFVGPVLAIADFIIFDYRYISKKIHILYGITPPLCYVLYVVISGQFFNVRWGDDNDMLAPYNFMNYGESTGWFGFDLSQMSGKTLGIGVAYMVVFLVLIFLGLGALYLKIKDVRAKSKMQ